MYSTIFNACTIDNGAKLYILQVFVHFTFRCGDIFMKTKIQSRYQTYRQKIDSITLLLFSWSCILFLVTYTVPENFKLYLAVMALCGIVTLLFTGYMIKFLYSMEKLKHILQDAENAPTRKLLTKIESLSILSTIVGLGGVLIVFISTNTVIEKIIFCSIIPLMIIFLLHDLPENKARKLRIIP